MAGQQILIIHGGDTYSSTKAFLEDLERKELDFETLRAPMNDWKRNLAEDIGDAYEVLRPRMPNGNDARYVAWKIWFEKILPRLDDNVILVGHSLGAAFLIKYLAENTVTRTVRGTFLVGAPYDDGGDARYSTEFNPPEDLSKFTKQSGMITFYHSTDDPIVPFSDFEKYRLRLPNARFVPCSGRKHFFDEHFPELVKDIQTL